MTTVEIFPTLILNVKDILLYIFANLQIDGLLESVESSKVRNICYILTE